MYQQYLSWVCTSLFPEPTLLITFCHNHPKHVWNKYIYSTICHGNKSHLNFHCSRHAFNNFVRNGQNLSFSNNPFHSVSSNDSRLSYSRCIITNSEPDFILLGCTCAIISGVSLPNPITLGWNQAQKSQKCIVNTV